MSDLKNPKLIIAKGFLFLLLGLVAAGVLLVRRLDPTDALLLAVAVWAFCRFYYFAFYVIEHYVDPHFKFSGLYAALLYLLGRRSGIGE